MPCMGCYQDITEVPHRNVPKTPAELRQRIPDLCAMRLAPHMLANVKRAMAITANLNRLTFNDDGRAR
jgi:hypothetical protein